MIGDFALELPFTLHEEGGNDDDPHDHGGRTSRGITQREWDVWRATHGGLPRDVWDAPQTAIEAIYQEQYWNPYCDGMPAGLDLAFFDFNVNAGRHQAVVSLQRALGVEADGMLGMLTRDAIGKADIPALIRSYADRRRAFYHSLAQFSRYGSDWIGRTARCEAAAEKFATAKPAVHVPTAPPPVRSPKANPADKAQPPVKPPSGVVVSGGAGGLIGALHQLGDQLAPYAGTVRGIEYALTGIALIAFAFTLYGFWHQSRTQALAG